MKRKFSIFLVCAALLSVSTTVAMAANETNDDVKEAELAALLNIDESQYNLPTTGNATLIVPGDPLLDGEYENGELVNGSIYYSIDDAIEGVKRDKIEAKNLTRVDPNTGVIEGPGTYGGDFKYTVRKSGRTYSFTVKSTKTNVNTQSDIYYDSNDTYLTSEDYNYVVTLMDSNGNAKGSFKAYPNNKYGGVTFSTTSWESYYLKIVPNSFPANWYLHGTGNVDS